MPEECAQEMKGEIVTCFSLVKNGAFRIPSKKKWRMQWPMYGTDNGKPEFEMRLEAVIV